MAILIKDFYSKILPANFFKNSKLAYPHISTKLLEKFLKNKKSLKSKETWIADVALTQRMKNSTKYKRKNHKSSAISFN